MRYLIGIGNYYGLDDSVGLRIAEEVSQRGMDCGFDVIDMGGNLFDLVHYLDDETERVLIVDSARMGAAPGTFAFFEPASVLSRRSTGAISTHEGDLLKILDFAQAMGKVTGNVTILGIEPLRIADEPGLTAPLADRLEEYIAAAIEFLTSPSADTGSAR